MNEFDYRSLFTLRAVPERLPLVTLRTAYTLASRYHHLPDGRTLKDAARRRRVELEKCDPEAIRRFAQGNPRQLITWKARCAYTHIGLQPEAFDVVDPVGFSARWRRDMSLWIGQAAADIHHRVMMHAVMEHSVSLPALTFDDGTKEFPLFFRHVYDPVIALTVMDSDFGIRLSCPDLAVVPLEQLPSSNTHNKLCRAWSMRWYGLDPDAAAHAWPLLMQVRRLRHAGDYLILKAMHLAENTSTQQPPRDYREYLRWIAQLPGGVITGAEDRSALSTTLYKARQAGFDQSSSRQPSSMPG